MLLEILDANGVIQKVTVKSQEAVSDHSGTIAATGTPQEAIPEDALRSGMIIQNIGSSVMYISEDGVASAGSGSFQVPVGGYFPPAGFPLTTGAISIIGTAGDAYTARTW